MATAAIVTLAGCERVFGYSVLTLKFPDDVSLGDLWLMEDANCFTCGNRQESLGKARGIHKINLFYGWFISLDMPKQASSLMPYLADSSLTSIGEINLEKSDIRDGDLRYLAGMNLRSIRLNQTGITGEGLKYLKPHEKWFSVELYDCQKLDLKYLVHFKGWERATITVRPPKMDEKDYTPQEQQRLKQARQIICDGQPEEICRTQIR